MKTIFKHIETLTTYIRTRRGYSYAVAAVLLVGIGIFYSCSNKNEVVPTYGTLKIQVVDANNKPVPLAKVGAFVQDAYYFPGTESPYSTFLNLYNTYNMAGAGKDTGTTDTQGYVTLDKVLADKYYLIMAHTRQPGSTFTEYYIDYDNYDGGFALPIELQKASVMNAKVKVVPANAWVVFWTDLSNSGIVPIKVKATPSDSGEVSGSNTSPQIRGIGNYVAPVRKGYQKFYAVKKSSFSTWTIDTNVVANTFMFVKLGTASNKVVSFYASDSLSLSPTNPITVTVGQNQVIGTITAGLSGIQSACGSANMVSANLTPGNYTYFAKSASGDCYWTGSFTVGTSACQTIRLGNCKP